MIFVFSILDKHPSAVFKALLKKYFPNLPLSPTSPTYTYLITPIELAFNAYHNVIKEDLENLIRLATINNLTQQDIDLMPKDVLDLFGTLNGLTRKSATPARGILKVNIASQYSGQQITIPVTNFSHNGNTYTTYSRTLTVPETLQIFVYFTGNGTSAPAIPADTEVSLAIPEVTSATVYTSTSPAPEESNWEFYSRIMGHLAYRGGTLQTFISSIMEKALSASDYTVVGARDNRMFRDLAILKDDQGNDIYTHVGGMIDVYTVPRTVAHETRSIVVSGLTTVDKAMMKPYSLFMDTGAVLLNGTVTAVDYPAIGTFLESYMNQDTKTYDIPLDTPCINLADEIGSTVLDVVSISKGGSELIEGDDFVVITADRGTSFSIQQNLFIIFNPSSVSNGDSVSVNMLTSPDFADMHSVFVSGSSALAGVNCLLRAYNPITVKVSMSVNKGAIDTNSLVNTINGSMYVNLQSIISNVIASGGTITNLQTEFLVRTPTLMRYKKEGVTTLGVFDLSEFNISFPELYRFYTTPELITINEV